MTAMFEERERGYEAKWAHDAEIKFKVQARRDDLLARWAAHEMGLSPAETDHYAEIIIKLGMTGKSADPVFERIRADFAAGMVKHTDRVIHRMMEDLFHAASNELASEEAARSKKS